MPNNDNGYVMLDCFIFMASFEARDLATKGTQIPYCNTMQDDDWNYNQPVDGDEKVHVPCGMTLQMANLHMRLAEPK